MKGLQDSRSPLVCASVLTALTSRPEAEVAPPQGTPSGPPGAPMEPWGRFHQLRAASHLCGSKAPSPPFKPSVSCTARFLANRLGWLPQKGLLTILRRPQPPEPEHGVLGVGSVLTGAVGTCSPYSASLQPRLLILPGLPQLLADLFP